jgi:hypothetical protein
VQLGVDSALSQKRGKHLERFFQFNIWCQDHILVVGVVFIGTAASLFLVSVFGFNFPKSGFSRSGYDISHFCVIKSLERFPQLIVWCQDHICEFGDFDLLLMLVFSISVPRFGYSRYVSVLSQFCVIKSLERFSHELIAWYQGCNFEFEVCEGQGSLFVLVGACVLYIKITRRKFSRGFSSTSLWMVRTVVILVLVCADVSAVHTPYEAPQASKAHAFVDAWPKWLHPTIQDLQQLTGPMVKEWILKIQRYLVSYTDVQVLLATLCCLQIRLSVAPEHNLEDLMRDLSSLFPVTQLQINQVFKHLVTVLQDPSLMSPNLISVEKSQSGKPQFIDASTPHKSSYVAPPPEGMKSGGSGSVPKVGSSYVTSTEMAQRQLQALVYLCGEWLALTCCGMALAVGEKGLLHKLYEVRYDGRPVEFLLFLVGVVRSQVREDEVDKLELSVRLYKYPPTKSTAIFNIDFRKLCESLAELRGDCMTESDIQRRFFAKIIATTWSFDFIFELNKMGRRIKWNGEITQDAFYNLIQAMDDWLARQGKLVTRTFTGTGGAVHVAYYSGLHIVDGALSPEEAACMVLSDGRGSDSFAAKPSVIDGDFAAIVQIGLGGEVGPHGGCVRSSGGGAPPADSGDCTDLVLVVASSSGGATGMARFPSSDFAGERGAALQASLDADKSFKAKSLLARPGQTPRVCFLRFFKYTADGTQCAICQCQGDHFRIDHPSKIELKNRLLGAAHDGVHRRKLIATDSGRETALKSRSGRTRDAAHVVLLTEEQSAALPSGAYADPVQVFADETADSSAGCEEVLFAAHVAEDGVESLDVSFGHGAFPAVESAGTGTPIAAAGAGGLQRVRRAGNNTGVSDECDPAAGYDFATMLRLNQQRNSDERFHAKVASTPTRVQGDAKGLSFAKPAVSAPSTTRLQRASEPLGLYTGLSASPAGPPAPVRRARYHGSSSSSESGGDDAPALTNAEPQLAVSSSEDDSKDSDDSSDSFQLCLKPPSPEGDSDGSPVGASLGVCDTGAQNSTTLSAADVESWGSERPGNAPGVAPAQKHWILRWAVLVLLAASLEYSNGWRSDNNSAELLGALLQHTSMGSVTWEVVWACLCELSCSLAWELGAEIIEVFRAVSGADVTTTGAAICGSTWHICTSAVHLTCALALGVFFSLRQRGIRTIALLYLAGRHAADATEISSTFGDASGGGAPGVVGAGLTTEAAVDERTVWTTVKVVFTFTAVVIFVSHVGANTCWECVKCLSCSLSSRARAFCSATSNAQPGRDTDADVASRAVLEQRATALEGSSISDESEVPRCFSESEVFKSLTEDVSKLTKALTAVVVDRRESAESRNDLDSGFQSQIAILTKQQGACQERQKAADERQNAADAHAIIKTSTQNAFHERQDAAEKHALGLIRDLHARTLLVEEVLRDQDVSIRSLHDRVLRIELASQEQSESANRSNLVLQRLVLAHKDRYATEGQHDQSASGGLGVEQAALQAAQDALGDFEAGDDRELERNDARIASALDHEEAALREQEREQVKEQVGKDEGFAQALAKKDVQAAADKQAALHAQAAKRQREVAAKLERDRAMDAARGAMAAAERDANARFEAVSTGVSTDYANAAAHGQANEQCAQIQQQVQPQSNPSAGCAEVAGGREAHYEHDNRKVSFHGGTVNFCFKKTVNCWVKRECMVEEQHDLAKQVMTDGATVHLFRIGEDDALVFPAVAANERTIGEPTGMFGGNPRHPSSFESFLLSPGHHIIDASCQDTHARWLAFDYNASCSQTAGGGGEGVGYVPTFGRSHLGWFPVVNWRFWDDGSPDFHYTDASILVVSRAGDLAGGDDTEWPCELGQHSVNLGKRAPYLVIIFRGADSSKCPDACLRRIIDSYDSYHGSSTQEEGSSPCFDVWMWNLTKYVNDPGAASVKRGNAAAAGKGGGGKGSQPGKGGKGKGAKGPGSKGKGGKGN